MAYIITGVLPYIHWSTRATHINLSQPYVVKVGIFSHGHGILTHPDTIWMCDRCCLIFYLYKSSHRHRAGSIHVFTPDNPGSNPSRVRIFSVLCIIELVDNYYYCRYYYYIII